jgi:hypothetical protein
MRRDWNGRFMTMRIRKTLVVVLAAALAVAFSPLPELRAAALVGPGSQAKSDNLIVKVAGKKGKKAKKKGPGACGAYMYWSKKTRKCEDARLKK